MICKTCYGYRTIRRASAEPIPSLKFDAEPVATVKVSYYVEVCPKCGGDGGYPLVHDGQRTALLIMHRAELAHATMKEPTTNDR